MDDRRVHEESNATDVPRRHLLSTDNKSPVVVLTCVVIVQNPWRPAQPEISSPLTGCHTIRRRRRQSPVCGVLRLFFCWSSIFVPWCPVEALPARPYGPFHKFGNPIVAKQRE
ncbi:unnamed protein product [Nippostrongylus brasiliensis]|uniref:Uncharacterized protein n=1 Tax=Nippostrongylus brasiliensis TaxID=27835 RepID=A0A0N4Y4U7_NIPBR|nr:unnamed protein product [Nippostrongylus brasiliensis]